MTQRPMIQAKWPTEEEIVEQGKLGLKPLVVWVPDTEAEGYEEEAQRQSRALTQSPGARDDMEYVDSIADTFAE